MCKIVIEDVTFTYHQCIFVKYLCPPCASLVKNKNKNFSNDQMKTPSNLITQGFVERQNTGRQTIAELLMLVLPWF